MLVCNFGFFVTSSYYKTYSVKAWACSIFCIAGIYYLITKKFGGPIWRVGLKKKCLKRGGGGGGWCTCPKVAVKHILLSTCSSHSNAMISKRWQVARSDHAARLEHSCLMLRGTIGPCTTWPCRKTGSSLKQWNFHLWEKKGNGSNTEHNRFLGEFVLVFFSPHYFQLLLDGLPSIAGFPEYQIWLMDWFCLLVMCIAVTLWPNFS